ncbi:fimbrial protein [Pseudomonas fluorescens]|jgi:major type 1 subunit fimbrin (pilin)|uniref:Fimbrial protein n=2 Tax=Pseudomonas TaxID=286 RepID=A0A0A6FIA6_9PSED|nr:fimbrial protein [Pseudomonas fluorescens]KHA72486.1 fimbrial protein [Pseudomonas chlororaphis]VVQ20722.1 Major fimbrial subunit SMF-1 [Pseudomonas fluorescens]
MNRKALAIAVLVSASGVQFANAADGTINFNGELVNQTCTIAVDGVVSPAVATVTLPTISTGLLTAAGQVEGQTGFNIQLTNCVGTATTAAAFFNSGATVDPISGNLKNMTGSANNVQLQLVDQQGGAVIQAGNTNQIANTTRNTIDGTGAANMPYAVQYFATGATTPGTVVSSVTYNVDYQ